MAGIGEDIARLAQLRDQGVLTEVEFNQQKARLLNSSLPPEAAPIAERKKSRTGKGCMAIVGLVVLLMIIGMAAGRGDKAANVVAPEAGGGSATVTKHLEEETVADAPRLSMDGYNRLRNGMSYEQVTAIIGQPSQEMSRSELAGMETVMYMWEGSFGANMNAMFQNGKLIQKAQFGLR